MNKARSEIFLGASDLQDYFIAKILSAREDRGLETVYTDFGIYCSKREWNDYLFKMQDLRLVQCGNSYGYMFDDEGMNYIRYDIHSTHITITLTGDEDFADKYDDIFANEFEFVTNEIEWLYSNDGQSIEIPLRHDRLPVEEMYPFLEGETLEEVKARMASLKPKKQQSISADLLRTANSYDDKVALIRMIVAEDSTRVAGVLKSLIQ